MKARIAEVFLKYPPAMGGHERYVQDLAEGLAGRGLEVQVFTTNLHNHQTGEVLANAGDPATAWMNGVKVLRLASEQPPSRRVVIPDLRKHLLRSQPDIIHAHDIWRHSTEVAIDVASELGVPLILSPVFHDRSREADAPYWQQELMRIRQKIPASTKVLFNTSWEEHVLAELGITFSNVGYLPPSVDLGEIENISYSPLDSIPRDRFLVTYVGRMVPSKGIDLLVESFARALHHFSHADPELAERLHLVLAGFHGDHDELQDIPRHHGIDSKVTFLYDRPRADIINLMRQSDLFVLPSRVETFGIVVIEAWATGNLVIVSDRTALPYVVEHGRTGLVCSDNELASTMCSAIQNRRTDAMEALARQGRQTVEHLYTRDRQLDRMTEYLHEALNEDDRQLFTRQRANV